MELTVIMTELQETFNNIDLPLMSPPYKEDQSLEEKFNKTYKELQRKA